MRRPVLPVLATGLLTLSLLVPTLESASAAGPDREVSGPELPEQASATARERASDALAEAQALFAERSPAASKELLAEGGADATMVLNQLMRVRDDLTRAERREADALVARPTDGASDPEGDGYTTTEATPVCGDIVCVHYVTTTVDAPPLADGDDEGTVPDSVDQALATAEAVSDTYVAAGYRRPHPDSALGGRTNMVDIYLADVGGQGLYGYCAADDRSSSAPYYRAAYCVIDDDYSAAQFGTRNPPVDNQRVTLAHEYYHAVQFAYDAFEDPWIMEATATWAEDEVFDDVNDNRQYLDDSQLRRPRSPLDRYTDGLGRYQYGNWIFFSYLTERWTESTGTMPKIVLDVWKGLSARNGAPDHFSTQALHAVLAARGTNFTTVYGEFAQANRRPASTYPEGANYPVARPVRRWTLSKSARGTGGQTATLDHLTSAPYRFRPGSDLRRRDWQLRVTVDMPSLSTAPVARVTTHFEDGEVVTRGIRLRESRASTKTLGFSARNVRYVELVLVNASRRVRNCWTDNFGDVYACYGASQDNNRRTAFRATAFR